MALEWREQQKLGGNKIERSKKHAQKPSTGCEGEMDQTRGSASQEPQGRLRVLGHRTQKHECGEDILQDRSLHLFELKELSLQFTSHHADKYFPV